jgi:hypothetical protein
MAVARVLVRSALSVMSARDRVPTPRIHHIVDADAKQGSNGYGYNHGDRGYIILKQVISIHMLVDSGGRQKTLICGHKEPFLRKNKATTCFLGKFWV